MFGRSRSTDDLLDLGGSAAASASASGTAEQVWGDHVHAGVGGLGRQDGGDQQLKGLSWTSSQIASGYSSARRRASHGRDPSASGACHDGGGYGAYGSLRREPASR